MAPLEVLKRIRLSVKSGSLKLPAKSMTVSVLLLLTLTSAIGLLTKGALLSRGPAGALPSPASEDGKSALVVEVRNWRSEMNSGAGPWKARFRVTVSPPLIEIEGSTTWRSALSPEKPLAGPALRL